MAVKSEALKNPHLAALLDLMQKNPHLPVVPMVSSEVVANDDWYYWMGSWGAARVDQYFIHNGRMFFKDDEDPWDVLERTHYPRDVDDMSDEEIDAAYDALPWIKCIVVYIGTPED